MDKSTTDDRQSWGKDSLEFLPTALIGISNKNIIYCNQSALALFNASDKTKLLTKKLSDFVSSRHKEKLLSYLYAVTKSPGSNEKVVLKFKNLDKKTLELELCHVSTTFEGHNFSLIALRDITSDKKKEIVQRTILKILNAGNSSLSIENLCDYLYKTVADIVPVKNFYVAIYDKTKQLLTFPFYKDDFSPKPADRKFGNGLTEYVIKTKKTLFLSKDKIHHFIHKGLIASSDVPVTGWLGVPLVIHEDIGGAIVIKEYHEENLLSEEAKEIIELVAYPISRAIERAIVDEERKKYTFKLQELNKAKDKFFSIISHDLKSPFNSILGFTEILKDQSSLLEEGEREQIFNSLYNSTRNTYNLLNNLLQYSKFQVGLVEFKPQPINLKQVVKENLNILEGTALKKQIYLNNNLKEDIVVASDGEMLNSILRNLINNAIKFTKESGEISISASEEKDFAKIKIKDSGVGMSTETLNNLFKMDAKKSTPGTNKEEGTGLGLLLVKEFVERNGGQIFVK
ncbi:MAG: GAF domain-containing sensor histidine kinase, partial [Ignavibacteriaceae bacterium]|nr:GAF domain-containing sensor histidine kinase [Ignavibacteriaceae bacterium]